jgi:hypothetical protein
MGSHVHVSASSDYFWAGSQIFTKIGMDFVLPEVTSPIYFLCLLYSENDTSSLA